VTIETETGKEGKGVNRKKQVINNLPRKTLSKEELGLQDENATEKKGGAAIPGKDELRGESGKKDGPREIEVRLL